MISTCALFSIELISKLDNQTQPHILSILTSYGCGHIVPIEGLETPSHSFMFFLFFLLFSTS